MVKNYIEILSEKRYDSDKERETKLGSGVTSNR